MRLDRHNAPPLAVVAGRFFLAPPGHPTCTLSGPHTCSGTLFIPSNQTSKKILVKLKANSPKSVIRISSPFFPYYPSSSESISNHCFVLCCGVECRRMVRIYPPSSCGRSSWPFHWWLLHCSHTTSLLSEQFVCEYHVRLACKYSPPKMGQYSHKGSQEYNSPLNGYPLSAPLQLHPQRTLPRLLHHLQTSPSCSVSASCRC